MRLSRRRTAIVSTFVLAALVGGCFEPPVAERMLLEFLSDGAARATLMIDLGRAEDFESPAVRKRIATAERQLLGRHRPLAGALRGAHAGDRRHQLPALARGAARVPALGRARRAGRLFLPVRRRSGGLPVLAQRRPGDARDLPQRRQPRDAQGAPAGRGRGRGVERRLRALSRSRIRARALPRGQSGKKKKLLAKGVRGEIGRRRRARGGGLGAPAGG